MLHKVHKKLYVASNISVFKFGQSPGQGPHQVTSAQSNLMLITEIAPFIDEL